jgi:putative drug exporter of the RND superfamily
MRRCFAAVGRFSIRYRWPVVAVWIAATVLAVAVLPSISSVAAGAQADFIPATAPSEQAANLLTPFQDKNAASMLLVVARQGSRITAADQTQIAALKRQIRELDHVTSVTDLGETQDDQADTILIQAAVPAIGSTEGNDLVSAIRQKMGGAGLADGLQAHLTGEFPIVVDAQSAASYSRGITELLSLAFILVILLVTFRAVLAPLITLLVPALVLALANPVIAEFAKLGLSVSALAPAVLVAIVLGAGADYGLFLVFRLREELRNGREPGEAIVQSVSAVGESISFSALIVITALILLLGAQFGFYRGMGPPLAIGMGLTLLAGLTLLPALLSLAGRNAFWPVQTRQIAKPSKLWAFLSRLCVARPRVTALVSIVILAALAFAQWGTMLTGFADETVAPAGSDSAAGDAALSAHAPGFNPFPTSAVFVLGHSVWTDPSALIAIDGALRARTGYFSDVSGPIPVVQVQSSLTALTVSAGSKLVVTLHGLLGPPQKLAAEPTNAQLQAITGIVKQYVPVASPKGESLLSEAAYQLYRATQQNISEDGRTVQFFFTPAHRSLQSPADINSVPQLRSQVSAVASLLGIAAVDSGMTGVWAFAYDVQSTSQQDLNRLVPIVAVAIAIILALATRSLIAPLFLVPSVVVSYFAALGLSSILFVHVLGQPGLQFVLPFLMFVFLVALGSDYNLLVMMRIREEAARKPLREAVETAVRITGSTVTTAGIVLSSACAIVAIAARGTATEAQVGQLGFGLAIGILVDTFIVRSLLVPAMVAALGHRTWWPSRRSAL